MVGHIWLGFEQAWAHPLVALATAYAMELAIEALDAAVNRRRPRYLGGIRKFAEFLLSAHITGLAVSMLLYTNERLWVVAFAVAVAIGSKTVLRTRFALPQVPAERWGTRHFLNPSNFGISVTLLLFPWVGIAPPYHFTENVSGIVDWILPGIIVCTGTFLNMKFTEKLPLIARVALGVRDSGRAAQPMAGPADSRRAASDDGPCIPSFHLLHGHRPGDDAE